MVIIKRFPSSLQIASWIAQSIRNIQIELETFLYEHEIDIILLQETILKPTDKFRILNYNTYRNDRETGPGGGTAILI